MTRTDDPPHRITAVRLFGTQQRYVREEISQLGPAYSPYSAELVNGRYRKTESTPENTILDPYSRFRLTGTSHRGKESNCPIDLAGGRHTTCESVFALAEHLVEADSDTTLSRLGQATTIQK